MTRFLSDLVREAAEPYGFTPDELIAVDGACRFERAQARWAVMWALRQRGLSTTRIGMVLRRDHSTVLHGLRRYVGATVA